MTIRELKKEVEMLGFANLCELEDSLAQTANRALRMIHTYHPKVKRVELGYFPEEPVFTGDILVGCGEEVSLSLPAGLLKMKLQGEGKYRVFQGASVRETVFSAMSKEVQIPLAEEGKILFSADSDFCAWDIRVVRGGCAALGEASSQVGNFVILDLRALFPDLLYLTDLPKNAMGTQISGLTLPDVSHMMIPKNYRGVISLSYRSMARDITEDMDEDELIDISAELTPLLPLLVAYFIWLDSDPDAARAYLAEYEKLSEDIRKNKTVSIATYIDTNGWA